ncbi:hypothetical protein BDF19DRAFT_413130 [Syncephalis fuscata]|nr:hypothetical protein BDF19DRAFT_413130 [Syncephalis fuscata]
MASIDARVYNASFIGLGTQLGISWGITILSVAAFEVVRRTKRLAHLYTPRCRLTKNATPPIPAGLFQWIPATLKLSEDFMLSHTGLDTVMHLRYLKTSFRLMLISTLIIGCALMPLNRGSSHIRLHHNGTNEDAGQPVELEIFSMSQIPNKEPVLYVHMILIYVFTALTIWLFYRDMCAYEHLCREFNLSRVRDGMLCARTVMVTELPKHLRTDDKLRHHFTSLGIGQVEKAVVLRSSGKLHRRLARREQHLMELEQLHIELACNILSAVETRTHERRNSSGNGPCNREDAAAAAITTTVSQQHADSLANAEDTVGDLMSSSPLRIGEAARPTPNIEERPSMLSTISRAMGINSPGPSSAVMRRASTNILTAATRNRHGNAFLLDPNASMDHDSNFDIWRTLSQLPREALDPFQPMRLSVRSHPARQQPAIDYHLRKFNKQDRRVAELRASYVRDAKPTATGFVTFVHPASAQLCAQSLISVDASRCRIRMAPTPRDIIWQNHKVNLTSRRARRTTVNIAVSVLTVFWFFIMSSVLVLTNFDKLAGGTDILERLNREVPYLAAFIKNTLPTLIIALLMSILPYILLHISERAESLPTYSAVEAVTLRRYYLFAIFNIVIVFLLGRTFLDSFADVLSGKQSIYDTLGKVIPQGATFFINYIVFSTCIHSLELLQLFVPFIYAILMTSGIIRNAPRTFQQRTSPMSFPYFYYFPLHILMLVIAMIYAVINPLILIFGAIYFATAYLVFKHQFAYAYVRRYETGGRYWRKAFTYTVSSLLLVHLTMIGVLTLKEMTYASIALAPPIVLTIAFLLWCHKSFYRRIKYIPLESLRDTGVMVVDRTHAHVGDESVALDGRPVITDAKRGGGVDVVSFMQGSPCTGSEPTPQPPLDTVRNQAIMRFTNNVDNYGGPGLHSSGPGSIATHSSNGHTAEQHESIEKTSAHTHLSPADAKEEGELSSLNSDDLLPSPYPNADKMVNSDDRPEMQYVDAFYPIRQRVDSAASADMGLAMQRTDTANTASTASTTPALAANPRRFHWPLRPFTNNSNTTNYNNDGLPAYRRLNRASSQQGSSRPLNHSSSNHQEKGRLSTRQQIHRRVSLDLHRPLTVQIPSPLTENSNGLGLSPHLSELGGQSLASNQANNGGASTVPDRSVSSSSPTMDVRADLVTGHGPHGEAYPNPYTPQRRHVSCRRYHQDLTGDIDEDVYVDPDVIRPLSWRLWLPNNPTRRLLDLDATVEMETALISSRSRHDGRIGAFDRNGYFIPSQYQWLGGFPANMVADYEPSTTNLGMTSLGMTSVGMTSCQSSNGSHDEDDEADK